MVWVLIDFANGKRGDSYDGDMNLVSAGGVNTIKHGGDATATRTTTVCAESGISGTDYQIYRRRITRWRLRLKI